MKPVLTPSEMKAADQRAIASGTPETVLIERAGAAVAAACGPHARRHLWPPRRYRLRKGQQRRRRLRRGEAPAGNAAVGVEVVSLGTHTLVADLVRALTRADLVIDAMYGTGFRGSLDGRRRPSLARALDDHLVLAVDIPSGIDGTTGEARGTTGEARGTAVRGARDDHVCGTEARIAVRARPLARRRRAHRRHRDRSGHATTQVLDAPDLTNRESRARRA
jgi:NAD(P)H-hydrate epimerase